MEKNNEEWFEWERQATVHPIIMCMEAWIEPMKNEYGRPWPTSIIIYNKEIVSWYTPWPDLLDYGNYLIQKFITPIQLQALKNEIHRQAKELDRMFSRFSAVRFVDLSDPELLAAYKELHSGYVKWFTQGGLVEPIGHQGERLVKKILSGIQDNDEKFALVTTTTLESFSKRELRDLLNIAIAKKRGNEKRVESLLMAHAKKYFWIHNNYFSTEVLDKRFFEHELDLAMKKYPDSEGQIKKLKKELIEVTAKKAELVKKLGLDETGRDLIGLLDLFAWYQDYRKEYVMQMLHYLDRILEEIGKRRGFSLREMKYTIPRDIPLIMNKTFDGELIKERMNRYLFYFDCKDERVEHGTGAWSLNKEKEIFHSLKHKDEVLEITGMVANKGFVRGKARVTLSAKEAKDIQKGEVLITSMTSPDFITAMKKASAIVTNEGGILCHAAVISREFNIPCIVGTKLATKVFKTGDSIEVDGELGVVRKVG